MSHRVGALLLPAPPPSFAPTLPEHDTGETLDPALATLGAFFQAMLERYCGPAWQSIAPSEPIVKTLRVGFDPEDLDFSEDMVPMLALWREHDGVPTRLDDDSAQQSSLVNVLWVAPPADEQKLAARSPFFNAFSKAMLLAYKNERDPCWIRPEDEASDAARAYGSYVWGLAGIDGWTYNGTKRVPVQVPTGDRSQQFSAYLSTWTILESSVSDPSELGSVIDGVRLGTAPTEIGFDLTDRAPTDEDPTVLVRQSALIPASAPEDD